MRKWNVLLIICAVLLALGTTALSDPAYIYGIHDSGGESHMSTNKGWIMFTVDLGQTPNGADYSSYSNAGYGVIVRLNNGYGSGGTLPVESQYDNFAQRVKTYIQGSSGCNYWIIGNETNWTCEWPGNSNCDANTGEPITVARYVSCFKKCYDVVHPAVSSALLIPAATGTWGPPLPGQGIEGFLDYWVNILIGITDNGLHPEKIGALAIHCYTHGCNPALVTDQSKMNPPYETIFYNFQVYKNYMGAIPSYLQSKPVLITECDQNIECADSANPRHAWDNVNNGWVRAIYSEINTWNSANAQKIRCVCLFRWTLSSQGEYTFSWQDRNNIVADFDQAVALGYQWSSSTQNDANSGGDAGNDFNSALAISPSSYSGNANNSTDANDYYKFAVTSGQSILISMTPPAGADFDAYLYNPSGTQKASSTIRGNGSMETISFTADATGDWRLRVNAYSGSGNYNFSVSVTTPPSGTNLARNAVTYLECGQYDANNRGKFLYDGSTATKWCCAHNGMYTSGDHWIAFDLGSTCSVNSFVVKHASTNGDSTIFNTKTFYIESATSLMGPWTQEFYVDNSTPVASNTLTYGTAKNLRYIRFRVTKPNPSSDWAVRVQEFEVYGTAGTAQPVQIEAENYDNFNSAADGTDYHDSDTANSGGQYRSQGVDIESCSEGTYDVGWTNAAEWLEYPWNATTTSYTLNIRYAGTANGTCRLYVDGVDKTGSIALNSTGGWQTWGTKNAGTISVTTGWHDIKLQIDTAGFNLNYFTLTPGGTPTTGTITGNVKSGGANLSGATVSTNTGGYTTTTDTNGNYTLSNVTAGTYNVTASKSGYNSSTNNNVTVTANQTTTSNFTLTTSTLASQDFESMPSWSSSFDATWGSAASWSIVGSGQSGNFLQASRSSQGSSCKALVYTVPTNTNITLSIYLKCPSYSGGTYWMETAYKLGSNTAQDFDTNSATWTQIKKFDNAGTNGNNNTWTQYTATINTGSNTQVTIGFKHGASGCTGPTVGWDTLRIY